MAKASSAAGIAAVLLLLGRSRSGALLPPLKVGSVLNDLHRLTGVLSSMDDLGRMAAGSDLGGLLSALGPAGLSKLAGIAGLAEPPGGREGENSLF